MTSEMGRMWLKLGGAGVRPTRLRLALADIIFGKGDRHFTADAIQAEARESLRHPPSLGTVYNTLREFVAHGLLREIAFYDAKVWFDTKIGPHSHYYFEDTQELADIPLGRLPAVSAFPPSGAEVTSIDVIVRLKTAPAAA